ncbi:alpha/beta hydrolase [Streptacidiphilus sp. PB12-B1b]|uniref:alpha/beta fold hydrolase n=1 Tax=Streptacidiphilus sp. PB12-B1b TaxID=2705012 RepID=UPI0015FCF955|nr:alpha/beta hydrolase [Streptacidiphilus sp. PB12-B1b]QMU75750.1 alpha/beta hydrolase [Streptacidiphilus sp. PB12-B1b]
MDATAAVVRTALNSTSVVSGRLAGKGAFNLFRNPFGRSRIRPTEQPVMDRAEVRRMEVNGKTVLSYHWGDGRRPVLLVHGWESRGSRLAGFAAALLELGYSPVAFDAPGHGDSTGKTTTILEYRDIIVRLHAEYGDFDAIVAHSLGVTATFFALRQGVRAGRIATVGGVVDFRYVVEAFCAKLGLREQLQAELRNRIEHELFPEEPDIWNRFSVVHEPEQVQVPILVVHDDNDEMVAPAQALRITDAYAGRARLVSTARLGHRRILADPAVVATVVDFLTEAGVEAEADGVAGIAAPARSEAGAR